MYKDRAGWKNYFLLLSVACLFFERLFYLVFTQFIVLKNDFDTFNIYYINNYYPGLTFTISFTILYTVSLFLNFWFIFNVLKYLKSVLILYITAIIGSFLFIFNTYINFNYFYIQKFNSTAEFKIVLLFQNCYLLMYCGCQFLACFDEVINREILFK
uniref:Uncharacterized protein n=1 Tax=Strongyloides stercoralis TaxID=6248 RepID=A0A0K0EKC9_STRER